MNEKIKNVYNKIKHRYSNGLNNKDERFLLKTELQFELGDEFEIICNEENNPPSVHDLNCLIAKIIWKENYTSYYINLIFGEEKNFGMLETF